MEARLTAPFGHLLVRADEHGRATAIALRPEPAETSIPPKFPRRILEPLRDFLAGCVTTPDVPTAATGTAFQQAIWHALRAVEPGAPITYGEMALRVGRPGAARAVGQALRINPLPIVWPCHRVVAAGGGLGGFGGASNREDPADRGQLDIKAWLLAHEARAAGVEPPAAAIA